MKNFRDRIAALSIGVLLGAASIALAATFTKFTPATGILKGSASTYVTTAATSADVIATFSGTCNNTRVLRADGACAQVDLTTNVTNTLPVGNGGTGITSGTSGGVPYFSASNTIASSAALTAAGIVLGGGAGAAPVVDADLSWNSTTNVLTIGSAATSPSILSPNNASGNGPNVAITAGNAGGAGPSSGGAVLITGGAGATTGTSGGVTLQAGTPIDGAGGTIRLIGANGVGTNRAGSFVSLEPGVPTGSGALGSIQVVNSTQTGAQTATFTATNKPGSGTTSPSLWLRIVASGTTYYIPMWQ